MSVRVESNNTLLDWIPLQSVLTSKYPMDNKSLSHAHTVVTLIQHIYKRSHHDAINLYLYMLIIGIARLYDRSVMRH